MTVSEAARLLGRSKSSVSRELRRNGGAVYSPADAQERYAGRRKRCRRKRRLADEGLRCFVQEKITEARWSPEQIVGRAEVDGKPLGASVATIYRAFADGLLPRAVRKSLRRGGKRYKRRGEEETRGRMRLGKPIEERPRGCEERTEIGHFESDSVEGRKGGACLTTHVDRKTRYLLCAKATRKADDTADAMARLFQGVPVKTFTPDRGREFAKWEKVSEATGAEAFFPPARQPWKRGTNENTNGLLREFFPKGCDFDAVSDDDVARAVRLLNDRPRKCLGYKTPAEAWNFACCT